MIFNDSLYKDASDKYLTLIMFFRMWRRKNELFFLIPELLDTIIYSYYIDNEKKTLSLNILNVFYRLYTGNIDINTKVSNKTLVEKILRTLYSGNKNKNNIKNAIIKSVKEIKNNSFEKIIMENNNSFK